MKVGIFSKRDRGEPTRPDECDERTLPAPRTRIAYAAIEASEQFGLAGRLGVNFVAVWDRFRRAGLRRWRGSEAFG